MRDSIADYTFTREETRIIQRALLQYIISEGAAAKHLSSILCDKMADAIRAEVETAEKVLKLL